MEKSVKGYDQGKRSAEKFIAMIDKYQDFDTMTTTMLNEFVEKILVHERDQKGRQDTGQEVEIYFNFVGKYIPPTLKEVEPTPEELEELRKKNERRERAHRAYLQRKASGAQKRYEDKIKAAKRLKWTLKRALSGPRIWQRASILPWASYPGRSRRGRQFESVKGDLTQWN